MISKKGNSISRALDLEFTERKKGVALSTLFFCISLFFLMLPLFLFILYPIALLFLKAFQGGDSLSFFASIVKKYRVVLWNSMESSFLSACISTVTAFVLSYGIVRLKGWKQSFCLLILSMSLVSPPFISSLSFISLYGRRGLISYRLLRLSLDPYNKYGVIGMQSLHFTCLNILFFLHSLRAMDGKLLYSGRDLGASPFTIMKDIVLPLLRPAFLASFFLSFLRALSDFGTPIIIGGRYSTLASEIYLQIIGYSDFRKTAAMNILLLLPAFVSFLLYRHAIEQSEKRNKNQKGKILPHFPENIWIKAILAIILLLFFLFQVLQYLCIFLYGFIRFDKGQIRFTLENMGDLFEYNLSTMFLTLGLALVTGFVGSFFAFILSYVVERKLSLGKKVPDFILSLPYLLPGTCFGLAYILAFNKAPLRLTGTVWIILFCMIFRQLPLGSRMASTALSNLPKDLEMAGRDLGGNPFKVYRDILFPILLPSFLSSVYNQFTQSLTTMGAVILLISAKYKVLVYTLFDAVNRGNYNVASLISGIMILLSLAFYLFLEGGRVLYQKRVFIS